MSYKNFTNYDIQKAIISPTGAQKNDNTQVRTEKARTVRRAGRVKKKSLLSLEKKNNNKSARRRRRRLREDKKRGAQLGREIGVDLSLGRLSLSPRPRSSVSVCERECVFELSTRFPARFCN